MSRYVALLVIVIFTVFIIVICSSFFLRPKHRNSASRMYIGVRAGRAQHTTFNQTKYKHNVTESDGRATVLPEIEKCGVVGDRITGGIDALFAQYSYIALLEYLLDHNSYSFDCSGSLINHRYVITAAHCLHNKNLVNVRLGEYDTSINPDCDEYGECMPEPINAGVEKILIHENYSTSNYINDIGLIRLSMNMPNERPFKSICLPHVGMTAPHVGQFADVLGWGSTGPMKRSSILQIVDLPIFDFEKCQKMFAPRQILQSQLCAGGAEGKDACTRDSGGPLIVGYSAIYYLEGIVSYGYGCGKNGTPGVYTRVRYYFDWIHDKLQP